MFPTRSYSLRRITVPEKIGRATVTFRTDSLSSACFDFCSPKSFLLLIRGNRGPGAAQAGATPIRSFAILPLRILRACLSLLNFASRPGQPSSPRPRSGFTKSNMTAYRGGRSPHWVKNNNRAHPAISRVMERQLAPKPFDTAVMRFGARTTERPECESLSSINGSLVR
jgi:hypothetical protein